MLLLNNIIIVLRLSFQNGHQGKWISTSFYGGKSSIQLMVLLSGLAWEKFNRAASFICVWVGSSHGFDQNQRAYRMGVDKIYKQHMKEVHRLLASIPLSVVVENIHQVII